MNIKQSIKEKLDQYHKENPQINFDSEECRANIAEYLVEHYRLCYVKDSAEMFERLYSHNQ